MSVCPVCRGTGVRPRYTASDRLFGTTDREFHVVACSDCGMLRLHPLPSAEELPGYYPPSYWFEPDANAAARLEETYRRIVLRDHVRFVQGALADAPAGPVLDVGCGGALFGRLLKTGGRRVMGLDFSHQAARVGWHTNGVPVMVGDFEHAPLRAGSLACVTMFHVLEHLLDPEAYVRAAAELLAPGGKLVVQVPNAASWQAAALGKRWNGLDVPRHLTDFRAADVDKLLERSGLEVRRHKFFSLRDNPAGLATSLAPGLDPMARRVRNAHESPRGRLLRDMVYMGLVAASAPFALLEAAFGAGATVMVEARKRRG